MPIYDYKCEKCGNCFEVIRGINEEFEIKCNLCGGKTKKIYHPAGIIFKGTGFYKTDSKKKQTKTKSQIKKEPPSGSSSKNKSANKN